MQYAGMDTAAHIARCSYILLPNIPRRLDLC